MSVAFFGQGMTNLGLDRDLGRRAEGADRPDGRHLQLQRQSRRHRDPLVIGYAYQSTGSFFGPLVYIGVVALIGAFSYSVILGDIHRLTVERS